MKVSLAATAAPGQAGPRHEDFYCVDESLGLFAIAEGLGPGGGLLSRVVLRTLRQFIVEHRRDPERAAPPLPSPRLQVGLMVAYRAVLDSEEWTPGEATALCAMLCDGDRLAIARFGGCRAYRLRGDRFEQLGEDIFDDDGQRAPWQSRGRQDDDAPSLALAIHDVAADIDDHWLLGTSGLPADLTAVESKLVIDAAESNELPGRKPIVDVAPRDGHTRRNVVIVGSASVSGAPTSKTSHI